jgi:NADPH2:quinone reductase
LGAYQDEGGWQSYAAAPDTGVRRIPQGLTFDQGCSLLLNYETPY